MRTVILVPYRPDGGRRDALWSYTRAWLENHHPECPIYVGASPDGLFNRSAAINRAAEEAGDWDVAVICDSDTFVPPAQFTAAIAKAHRTGLLVSALTKVVEMSRDYTDLLLHGTEFDVAEVKKKRTRRKDDLTQSSVLAVPRVLWDAIGGFDERFAGWGCEDCAFWLAATVHGRASQPEDRPRRSKVGAPIRITGPAYHLWHEQVSKIKLFDPVFRKNFAHLGQYKKLKTPAQHAVLRNTRPAQPQRTR